MREGLQCTYHDPPLTGCEDVVKCEGHGAGFFKKTSANYNAVHTRRDKFHPQHLWGEDALLVEGIFVEKLSRTDPIRATFQVVDTVNVTDAPDGGTGLAFINALSPALQASHHPSFAVDSLNSLERYIKSLRTVEELTAVSAFFTHVDTWASTATIGSWGASLKKLMDKDACFNSVHPAVIASTANKLIFVPFTVVHRLQSRIADALVEIRGKEVLDHIKGCLKTCNKNAMGYIHEKFFNGGMEPSKVKLLWKKYLVNVDSRECFPRTSKYYQRVSYFFETCLVDYSFSRKAMLDLIYQDHPSPPLFMWHSILTAASMYYAVKQCIFLPPYDVSKKLPDLDLFAIACRFGKEGLALDEGMTVCQIIQLPASSSFAIAFGTYRGERLDISLLHAADNIGNAYAEEGWMKQWQAVLTYPLVGVPLGVCGAAFSNIRRTAAPSSIKVGTGSESLSLASSSQPLMANYLTALWALSLLKHHDSDSSDDDMVRKEGKGVAPEIHVPGECERAGSMKPFVLDLLGFFLQMVHSIDG